MNIVFLPFASMTTPDNAVHLRSHDDYVPTKTESCHGSVPLASFVTGNSAT